jgi:hypothetical protein
MDALGTRVALSRRLQLGDPNDPLGRCPKYQSCLAPASEPLLHVPSPVSNLKQEERGVAAPFRRPHLLLLIHTTLAFLYPLLSLFSKLSHCGLRQLTCWGRHRSLNCLCTGRTSRTPLRDRHLTILTDSQQFRVYHQPSLSSRSALDRNRDHFISWSFARLNQHERGSSVDAL